MHKQQYCKYIRDNVEIPFFKSKAKYMQNVEDLPGFIFIHEQANEGHSKYTIFHTCTVVPANKDNPFC